MAGRRLSAEERALWAQLARSVRPIRRGAVSDDAPQKAPPPFDSVISPSPPRPESAATPVPAAPPRRPSRVLDDSWERQIKRGQLAPEMSIDLHGHSLSAAHARLDRALASARQQGVRVLLVVTGKPRSRPGNAASSGRGAIRAEIGHWLEAGVHADAIASVRTAHPRHGGDGAIYVILRRKK